MLKINVYAVGTIKEKFYRDAINEYLKRLSRFAKVEIIETPESKIQNSSIEAILNEEANHILKKIKPGEYVILVDLHGKEYSSEDFSEYIKRHLDSGTSPISFIIGGTLGLANELRNIAKDKICLSKMTFTHQMTRVILLEQIYRGFKIINNESYHH